MKSRLWSRKGNIPKQGYGKSQNTILLLFTLSLVFYLLAHFFPFGKKNTVLSDMLQASEVMEDAIAALRECRVEKGLVLDSESDPNQTGLIGYETSPLTTTLGNLEAKRTTTNPDCAALVVFLLHEAGVERGDTVAVGASSSFPALIVATLSAAKAMDLNALMICSLGASQWGANIPEFHWLDMLDCLRESGSLDSRPIALSLGGEEDTGKDMNAEGRLFLSEEIVRTGILFIQEPDLIANVQTRMRLYEKSAGVSRIKSFIHIGGSWANIGTDPEILELKPGLLESSHFPPVERRGVLFEMASRGIPVIHLLFVKGLADRYGLPWDPSPLPAPGKGKIYSLAREKQPGFLVLEVVYLVLVGAILIFRQRLQ
jgi:poly-gamma-glutamate system protein